MTLLAAALFTVPSFAVGSGELARDIVLTDMSGKQVSLDSFKGKTVVLNFWATWCPPCRGEMPEFDELHKEFQKTGEAVLLAVNLTDGRRETPERVAEFLKETGYTMTVLLDEKQEAASYRRPSSSTRTENLRDRFRARRLRTPC